MGGQLIKGYALEGDSQGTAGLTKAWKLYRGHKGQTHTLASIFLIEKKQLKRAERDETIKIAKKEASSLLRVRHPGVLAVLEPLTEDENILAFVTERVEGSMAQLIKNSKMVQFLNSELELKLYLYPFLETIAFIHDTLKQAHLAISPENIYVTQEGKWKLAGFGVNQQLTGEDQQKTEEKFYDFSFSAPQLALNSVFTKKTDIFSLGVFIVKIMQFIHKEQRPINIADRHQYEKWSGELKKLANSPVIAKSSHPEEFRQLLNGLLQWDSAGRWSVSEVLSSRWMNDSTLITVKYLDKISNYQNKQQLEFLKGLAGVIEDFDVRVLARIILPKLIDLFKFGQLIASVAYIIIDLLKKGRLTAQLFNKLVWPALKGVMQGKQMTAQAIYLFVLNYQILQKFIGEADTVVFLLPLYIKCFDCPPKLKQLALKGIQRLSKKLDYQNFKTRIVPKLLGLFKDPQIDIRKDALRALYGILKVIDAQTISLSVLPAIQAARKAGSDSFVNAIINAIYNNLSTSLPSDVLSNKILPVLIPYLSEPSISKVEFHQFKSTIINMINIIEKEREKTFNNNIVVEEANFTEADFKFKEEEPKPQVEAKGNYNFLANYMESKPDPNANVSPQSVSPVTNQNLQGQTIMNPVGTPMSNFNNPSQQLNFSLQIQPQINTQQTPFSLPKVENSPKFSIPITNQPQKEVDQMTTINYPMPSLEVKAPKLSQNVKISIQPTIPDPPAANPISYDFQGLKYQPLDINFTNDQAFLFDPSPAQKPPAKEEKKQSPTLPKVLPNAPTLQSKPSNQTKKETKFVGGASGPMEVKKLVGPQNKIKPPPQDGKKDSPVKASPPTLSSDYFQNAPKGQTSNFSMDFGNLGGLNMNFSQPSLANPIKPVSKPAESKTSPTIPVFSFDQTPVSLGSSVPSDPNNPFADIESGFSSPILQPPPIKPTTPFSKQAKNDIYSYFEEQEDNKEKARDTMDLI